ncbi:MAG: glycosyltransferase [Micropruina sp.]|nr:glycosyltransferase [Micropruina sp.]
MDQPLKIGIFTDDFYPESGGVSRSIELQVAELVRLGHHVTLVAPKSNLNPPEDCEFFPAPVYRIPGTPSFLCSLAIHPGVAESILQGHTFDVVHSQNERGSMILAARVARALGIPHVHTFHSNYAGTHDTAPTPAALNSVTWLPLAPTFLRVATGRRPLVHMRRPAADHAQEESIFARQDWANVARMASYFDAVTSPAQFVVNAIVDASGGALAGRAHVVPSGVSESFTTVTRQRPVEETVRFLSCGRLGREKRVDTIVKAFAKLDRPNTELRIVGSGPAEPGLKVQAKVARRAKIEFVGHVNNVDEVAQEFADADAFVLASYHFDTQGMVLAEAAAAGTPILYCDDRLHVGVGPDNALLVDPTPEALEEGMRRLVDDRPRLAAMAAASKALTPGLTTRAMEDNYVAIYRQAIARTKR